MFYYRNSLRINAYHDKCLCYKLWIQTGPKFPKLIGFLKKYAESLICGYVIAFFFKWLGTLPEWQLCVPYTWYWYGHSWSCWSFWSYPCHRCIEQEKSKLELHTQHSPSSWSHWWKCRIKSKIWGKGMIFISSTYVFFFFFFSLHILQFVFEIQFIGKEQIRSEAYQSLYVAYLNHRNLQNIEKRIKMHKLE